MLVVAANLARVGGRMGGCLVLLRITVCLGIINTGCTGQSCPGGWPNGRAISSASYYWVFKY